MTHEGFRPLVEEAAALVSKDTEWPELYTDDQAVVERAIDITTDIIVEHMILQYDRRIEGILIGVLHMLCTGQP
jgi:hypothetical protein